MKKIDELLKALNEACISKLENGVNPWVCPWDGTPWPKNGLSGHQYNGINILMLWITAEAYNYRSRNWFTHNQLRQISKTRGMSLDWRNQSPTMIMRVDRFLPKGLEDTEDNYRLFQKVFWVFNASQIKGLPDDFYEQERTVVHTSEAAQTFIARIMSQIPIYFKEMDRQACYVPASDYINVAKVGYFDNVDAFYATVFHELGHATGHKSRLNRTLSTDNSTKEYMFEELIAEITSSFLCSHFGVKGDLQHADYICHYIQRMKEDPQIIMSAAKQAQQAFTYLIEAADKTALHDLKHNPDYPIMSISDLRNGTHD